MGFRFVVDQITEDPQQQLATVSINLLEEWPGFLILLRPHANGDLGSGHLAESLSHQFIIKSATVHFGFRQCMIFSMSNCSENRERNY
jgi:hypothetical protein